MLLREGIWDTALGSFDGGEVSFRFPEVKGVAVAGAFFAFAGILSVYGGIPVRRDAERKRERERERERESEETGAIIPAALR